MAITITNVTDLQKIGNDPGYLLSDDYELGNDIDASATVGWNGGAGFEPIGSFGNPFTGSFDGKGYSITGLYIRRTQDDIGLFADIRSDQFVRDLHFRNCTIISLNSGSWCGTLAGYVFEAVSGNPLAISNCSSTGTVTRETPAGNEDSFGGLIGEINTSGAIFTLENCWSTCIVTALQTDFVGGLVGQIEYTDVDNCYATGNVTGADDTGGLFGYGFEMTVDNCYSTGNVIGDAECGGLFGYSSWCLLDTCYSTGNVTTNSSNYAGGLVGYFDASCTANECYATGDVACDGGGAGGVFGLIWQNTTITNCYGTGNVSFDLGGVGGNSAGGFAGVAFNSTISECYATGNVTSTTGYNLGGFVGQIYGSTTVKISYSTGDATTNDDQVGGFVGNIGGNASTTNCYARGNVSGNDLIGGFVGIYQLNGSSTNCYSTGAVTAVLNGGGFAGDALGAGTVVSCYWDIQTSGYNTSFEGTGKTTTQMLTEATYVGWDFTTPIWYMLQGEIYPQFEPVTLEIVKWLWEFGDGSKSRERSPDHVYKLPGVYTVKLTLEDRAGNSNSETKVDYIRVYDWDYLDDEGLNVSITNRCLRYAFRPNQGVGWAFYDGSQWIFPEARHASLMVFDNLGNPRTIVWDSQDGLPYEIGRKNIWKDKDGSYNEAEIDTEVRFREDRGEAEQFFLESLEHHVHFRPQDEDDRGTSGHDARGFRNDLEIDVGLLSDGEQITESAETINIPMDGDLVFDKKIVAHRQQLKVTTTTSQFKIVRRRSYYVAKDKAAAPSGIYMTEFQLQEMLADMLIWISRGPDMTTNLMDGVEASGSFLSTTNGADGKNGTAMLFNGAEGLQLTLTNNLSGDFTLMAWVNGVGAADIMGFSMGTARMYLTAAPTLGFAETGFDTDVPFTNASSGWNHLVVMRKGDNLYFYVNGTLLRTYLLPAYSTYGGVMSVMLNETGNVEDVRVLNRAITDEAITYIYNDVTGNSGDNVMNPV